MNKKTKKYLIKKIQDYKLASGINFSDMGFESFINWLDQLMNTVQKMALMSRVDLKNEFFHQKEFLQKNEALKIKWRILKTKIRARVLNNEGERTGSRILGAMLREEELEYFDVRIRPKVYAIIKGLRKELSDAARANNLNAGFIISGKIMSDHLKLDIPEDKIDGWMFTTNIELIRSYVEHERSKYEDLESMYRNLATLWSN